VHLVVCYLNKPQNARCNDKDSLVPNKNCKEQSMRPEDDRMIETCRSVLGVLM